MLKKTIISLYCAALLLPGGRLFAESPKDITVIVNGQAAVFEQPPFIENGTTLVPFRPIFERIGLTVQWDESAQTIQGKNHKTTITLRVGQREALVNEKPVELDAAPAISDGVTFVPLRFVGESLEGDVEWNEPTRTIRLGTTDEEKLRRAIVNGDEKQVLALLDEGAYPNYTDAAQQSLLELAVTISPAVTEALLKAGAETNSRNAQGDYPLHQAVKKHDTVLLQMLLDAKADAGVQDAKGRAPLELAVEISQEAGNDTAAQERILTIVDMLGRYNVTVPRPLFPLNVNGKYGYIDRYGTMIVPAQYDSAEPFSDDLAVVGVRKDNHMKYGYIGLKGNIVLEPQYDAAGSFQSGAAPVTMKSQGGLFAQYIDKQGKPLFPGMFTFAEPFEDQIAVVSTSDDHSLTDLKKGLIDREGNFIAAPQFKHDIFAGTPYGEGLFAVTRGGARWGYIDTAGKERIPFVFDRARAFSEGLAAVTKDQTPAGLYGYIDRNGTTQIEPKYKAALEFSEGLAPVQLPDSNGWGYIDAKGSMVIQPQFGYAGSFRQGIAPVKSLSGPGNMGYIDKHGDWVIPPIYDKASEFYNGLAKVQLNGTESYIDVTGRTVVVSAIHEL
ncbi:hypothetical protein DVH26_35830 [Paenibacillus sp. H1-7]|uniref:WG repeat-containing protein n=1 Tax=Paenibacillus sp. H1-7 TaxID=2282849 RepID=UPI001EF9A8C3|nr:WG repeat-containing protein [Paenibacillus sp. H1-7]ULL19323.1 hypothetical protein DVH26_35830 [Paenibacillus sp. H1-7]